MNHASSAPAIVSVLDEIGRWRDATIKEIDASLGEVAREEIATRKAMEEAHRRLCALAVLHQEQQERHDELTVELTERERAGLRQGLTLDRETLDHRSERVRQAVARREASVTARIEADRDLQTAVAEMEKFREVEFILDTLAPSVRRALREQHDRARRRLDALITEINAPPARLELEDAAGIGVVLSIQPPDGTPEALVAVLPVSFAVYRDWATRPEDLSTLLAYRLVGAVFRLLTDVGATTAPVRYVEVHGALALQVWLGDSRVQADFRDRVLDFVQGAWDEAAELSAAGLEVYAVWLRPELLAEAET